MKNLKVLVLLVMFFSQIHPAFSCSIRSNDGSSNATDVLMNDSINYLVKHSEIYLATAVSREVNYDYMAKFTFRVDKVLRGQKRDQFSLDGADLNVKKAFYENAYHDRLDRHLEPEFWAFMTDSSDQFGGCTNLGLYRVGTQYLLFLNDAALRRSFEPIHSEQDLWLQTVMQVANVQNQLDAHEKANLAPSQ